jgi:antirestriction protein ArdC
MSKDIYELITARFIEQLKRGTVPWQKPWMGVPEYRFQETLPRNQCTHLGRE